MFLRRCCICSGLLADIFINVFTCFAMLFFTIVLNCHSQRKLTSLWKGPMICLHDVINYLLVDICVGEGHSFLHVMSLKESGMITEKNRHLIATAPQAGHDVPHNGVQNTIFQLF